LARDRFHLAACRRDPGAGSGYEGSMLLPARLSELLGIEVPIVQAPMAGAQDQELALAVAEAGGLGSMPCSLLSADDIERQVASFRQRSSRPFNLNFICHQPAPPDPEIESSWRARLAGYYAELDAAPPTGTMPSRAPFDAGVCAKLEALGPPVVSFHFGLPAPALVARLRAIGTKILSSATTVAEARWLEENGCDAIIAQGAEAGGHRGMFLSTDVSAQVGTLALVPQVVDAVKLPVIAAGGIADARGIAAVVALGASGAQIGTAYLRCPESTISPLHRAALAAARDDSTRITNVLTGRPARAIENRIVREQGPLSDRSPAFPHAATALGPLRAKAEAQGSADFSPLWSGQAAALARSMGARELTRWLAEETETLLSSLGGRQRA
jgi:nitronate monooxygenase